MPPSFLHCADDGTQFSPVTVEMDRPTLRAAHVDKTKQHTRDARAGWLDDGRRWLDDVAVRETLALLDPNARATVILHTLHGHRIVDVAHHLGLSEGVAYGAHARGVERLRVLLREDCLDGIERVVAVLHTHASQYGRLPGRSTVCPAAGVTEARFAAIVAALVDAGCIVDRSARRPGRLVHTSSQQTMQALQARQA